MSDLFPALKSGTTFAIFKSSGKIVKMSSVFYPFTASQNTLCDNLSGFWSL